MKRFLIVFMLITAIILAAFWKIEKITIIRDGLHGFFIKKFHAFYSPGNRHVIIEPDKLYRYKHNYSAMPGELVHSGIFLFYIPRTEIRIRDIARASIKYTGYYSVGKLASDITKINSLSGERVVPGSVVLIPDALPEYELRKEKTTADSARGLRGLYFTGQAAGRESFLKDLPSYREAGINAVVFDVKDITGIINYESSVSEVREYGLYTSPPIENISKLLRELRKAGMYSIARIAVFNDALLADKQPALRIKSARTGGPWIAGSREVWVDPTNMRVQYYNLKLAVEIAELGADEVQFDYIRFPTAGNLSDAVYSGDFGPMTRDASIAHYLERVHGEINSRGSLFSIDIFGIVAWGKEIDIKKTGQRIDALAPFCDIISPMLYPSHFNDEFDGFARPGDNPWHFIRSGCARVRELAGPDVIIRPWLQAFGWRVSRYNADYIRKQIQGAEEGGASGYLFWNSKGSYSTVLEGLKK